MSLVQLGFAFKSFSILELFIDIFYNSSSYKSLTKSIETFNFASAGIVYLGLKNGQIAFTTVISISIILSTTGLTISSFDSSSYGLKTGSGYSIWVTSTSKRGV